MSKKKILLIGWDAADWKAINPLMDAGKMPNLEYLVNSGVMGNLATLDPPLSPMLWTSISTGKRPYKHGILGFSEPKPDGSGIRPVLNTSRKCKAIWNILTQKDYRTHLVGWWPSHPAEPVNGISISNFYQKSHIPKGPEQLLNWPMMEGTVHPKSMAELFSYLRVHPLELQDNHLLPFLPLIQQINQEDPFIQKKLYSLRKILADCTTIHNAATYIIDNEEWDFMTVYYDAIDHFGHSFMRYHPPKREHIKKEHYDAFHYIVEAGYLYHDMMLGKLIDSVDDDTYVMLISDHGFHPDHLRPKIIPREPAGPALEHNPYGIFVLKGPGIKEDERIYGASIVDITPTVLSILDLPIGKDMDGRPLMGIYESSKDVSYIDSWELIEGHDGRHPEHLNKDPFIDNDALEQMIELGYIEKPDENAEIAVKKTLDECNFWLARSYMDGLKYEEAEEILQKLFDENPDQNRYGLYLHKCLLHLKKNQKSKEVIEQIKYQSKAFGPSLLMLESKQLLLDNRPQEAIEKLISAEVKIKDDPLLYVQLGQAYMAQKLWHDSERSFKKAIHIDPDNERAFFGLGFIAFQTGDYENAAELFAQAISYLFYQPYAHFFLAQTLEKLGDNERAAKAYATCLEMNKSNAKARKKLQDLVGEEQSDHNISEKSYDRQSLPELIIVSGLPRSGTSLMMQMLKAGGLELFTDGKREKDENNPKGYYEHEGIKKLLSNKSILKKVEHKAVKIVSPLLKGLPLNYSYKIIYMDRDVDEVLDSQEKMILKNAIKSGKNPPKRDKAKLKRSFEQLAMRVGSWQRSSAHVNIIKINHQKLINDPNSICNDICAFLNKELDQHAMAQIVDNNLYRSRNSET